MPERAAGRAGWRVRWTILALIFGFAFSGYLQRNGVSVAAERMMPELGLTQLEIGWLLTAFLLAYAIFQLPGAVVGQIVGARRALTVIGLVTAVASVATAAAPAIAGGAALFVALVAARALLGVAQGGLFPVAAGTLRVWFPAKSWAVAIGCMVTGLWTGAAAAPPLVAWLMSTRGWRFALFATSVPSLLLVAVWYWLARDRPSEKRGVAPAELAELAANPPEARSRGGEWTRALALLADPRILRLTGSYFLMNYVFYLVTFWCFLYLVQERHFTVLESGWLASVPYVVAGIAAAAGGRLCDAARARWGDRTGLRLLPLSALPLSSILLYLTVSAANPYAGLAALCLGFACIELCEGSYWASAMRLAPSDSMAATALLNTGGNLGGVVATPVIAALSERGGWSAVFIAGAVMSLAAAALWLAIDPTRERQPAVARARA